MNFSKKDVIIGFILIVIIIFVAFYYKRSRNLEMSSVPTPVSISYKEEIENSFKYDIPEDSNSIALQDVSGGDSRGIATEREILVDADDPESGLFYNAWLEKDGNVISLGKLQVAKGGWLLEYDKQKYGDYENIIISLEKVNDNKLEKRILEGSFN